jgi:ATP-dependent Clp protease protease subunit
MDIDIQAKEILRMRAVLNQILAKHTGQPMDRIEQDTDRGDFILVAEEAKKYGIIDDVIFKK